MVCALAGLPGGIWHTVVFLVSAGAHARGSDWPATQTCAGPLSSAAAAAAASAAASSTDDDGAPHAAAPRIPANNQVLTSSIMSLLATAPLRAVSQQTSSGIAKV